MKADVNNLIKPLIGVSSSPPYKGITLTLEGTGVFLGILVSASALLVLGIKSVTTINKISSSIQQIEKDLKESAENAQKIAQLEKRLELHIQDYINRKDVVQMVMGQLNEKIDHKFKRLLFYSRDIQRFLQRDTAFQIREYKENTERE